MPLLDRACDHQPGHSGRAANGCAKRTTRLQAAFPAHAIIQRSQAPCVTSSIIDREAGPLDFREVEGDLL